MAPYFKDYIDENWQYWWVLRLTVPDDSRKSLGFVYEHLLIDGDVQKDYFEDPITVWSHRIIYGDSKSKKS